MECAIDVAELDAIDDLRVDLRRAVFWHSTVLDEYEIAKQRAALFQRGELAPDSTRNETYEQRVRRVVRIKLLAMTAILNILPEDDVDLIYDLHRSELENAERILAILDLAQPESLERLNNHPVFREGYTTPRAESAKTKLAMELLSFVSKMSRGAREQLEYLLPMLQKVPGKIEIVVDETGTPSVHVKLGTVDPALSQTG